MPGGAFSNILGFRYIRDGLGDLGVGKTSLVRTYTESGVVGGPGSAGSGGSDSGQGYKVSFDAGYHLKRLEVSLV